MRGRSGCPPVGKIRLCPRSQQGGRTITQTEPPPTTSGRHFRVRFRQGAAMRGAYPSRPKAKVQPNW